MKPIFTLEAGEYLVGSHLEEKYKGLQIWLPTSDTGTDLTRHQSETQAPKFPLPRITAVKFSKNFLGNKGGKNASSSINSKIKSGGWWTFKYEKIEYSQADL